MKNRLLNGFTIFLLIVIGAYLSLWSGTAGAQTSPSASDVSVSGKDDATARAQFEWLRLHNPATGSIPRDMRAKELAYAATLPIKKPAQPGQFSKYGQGYETEAYSWNHRGPINVGGRTRALAIDVSDENVILAGGISGGMWRSTDNGAIWWKETSVSDLQSVTCISQDRRVGKTNTWYYGTGEYVGNSANGGGPAYFQGDGIFKSTDDGVTWTLLSSTASNTPESFTSLFDYVWDVATDPSNLTSDVVYAATYGAIERSTDGGNTWNVVLGGASPYSEFTDVAVTSTGVAYAVMSSGGTQAGLWRSTDGINWTNITPSAWPATYHRTVIGIAPSDESVVYFLSETPGSGFKGVYNGSDEWSSFLKYTYISGDGSGSNGTWEDRSTNLPAFGGSVGDFVSQNSYDLVIKVKPDDENTVFIGGTNLYRSTDGFATSQHTTWIGGYSTANNVSVYANSHPDQHAIAFSPSNPLVIYSGNDGGVSEATSDTASTVAWTSLNNGYITAQFYSVGLDHATSGSNVVVGGAQDNGTWFTNSTSTSVPWINLMGGDGGFCAVADGGTSYYVASQNAHVYREVLNSNGVVTQWTRVDPVGGSGYLFVDPFALDPSNTNIMYLAGGQILWRNNDLTKIPLSDTGATTIDWDSLSATHIASGFISAIGVSKTPVGRVYYGTTNGDVYRLDNAESGNPSPVNVTGSGFPSGGYVSCIAVDPANGDNAVVVFSNYSVQSLFYTTDGGASWAAVGGNLEQNPDGTGDGPSCRWLAILPTGGKNVYFVGTSTGLYSTTSLNGASTIWEQEGSASIGNVVVDMVDVRRSDGTVVVATHGNGIYSGNISTELSWIQRSPMPTPRSWAPAVQYGGKIYVIGGCSSSQSQQFQNSVSNLETYDPGNNSWNELAPMPTARVAPVAVAVNGNIYVMGGFDPSYYWSADPTVEIYNITSNTWGTGTSMPTGCSWASGVSLGGKILVLGGVGSNYFNIVQEYDPTLDSWSSLPGFDGGRYLSAATTYSGKIYLIGGDSWETGTDTVYSDLQVYDSTTGSWTTKAPMPTPATDIAAVALNNKIYVFGGGGLALTYDISSNTWTSQSSDQDPSGSFSTALSSGTIYRFGGGGWGPTSNVVEALNIISTGVKNEPIGHELNYVLSQNYPNPFNPSTVIRYDLPANSKVSLKVYDVLGREVRTLVDERENAGSHSVTFNAGNLPSGVYFYRIEAGTYHDTKKLLLLK